MSPENVPEHEHQCKAIVLDLDDKASNITPVDANASLRVSPLSHEGIERPPVYFNGDSGVGSLVSNSHVGVSYPGRDDNNAPPLLIGLFGEPFRSLAFAAGYDPVAGPASDCPGQAARRTPALSFWSPPRSVSWYRRPHVRFTNQTLGLLRTDHGFDFHDGRFCCRLWNPQSYF